MFDWMETELPYVSVGIVVDRMRTVDRDHERQDRHAAQPFCREVLLDGLVAKVPSCGKLLPNQEVAGNPRARGMPLCCRGDAP